MDDLYVAYQRLLERDNFTLISLPQFILEYVIKGRLRLQIDVVLIRTNHHGSMRHNITGDRGQWRANDIYAAAAIIEASLSRPPSV